MSKLIDWYLVELRLRLEGKLPPDRVDTVIREAESHLNEAVRGQMALNVDEEAAARSAIQAYGKPDKVALGFLRKAKHKLFGLSPKWAAAFGCLIAIACWNFHWLTLGGYFDNFGETWQNELAGVIGLGGLMLVVAASRAGFRSHRLAIAATGAFAALASIPLVSFWMVGHVPMPYGLGVSRFHLERDEASLKRVQTKLDAYASMLKRGMADYASASSPASLSPDLRDSILAAQEFGENRFDPAVDGHEMHWGGQFIVPRKYGAFAEVDGRVLVVETVTRFAEAKQDWKIDGPKVLGQVETEQGIMHDLLVNAAEARSGRLFFFNPDLYNQTVYGALFLLPGLLLIDWIAVVTARPRRLWPGRRVVA